jgi:hypothetical protein
MLGRLSDIQRGLEVWSTILRVSIFTYGSFIEHRLEIAVGKAYLCQIRHIRFKLITKIQGAVNAMVKRERKSLKRSKIGAKIGAKIRLANAFSG